MSEMLVCETCATEDALIPGVRWPVEINTDRSQGWIERCDECEIYEDDYEAAEALATHLGVTEFSVRRLHRGQGQYQPYITRPTDSVLVA